MEVLCSRQELQKQGHLEDSSEGTSTKLKQHLERGEWLSTFHKWCPTFDVKCFKVLLPPETKWATLVLHWITKNWNPTFTVYALMIYVTDGNHNKLRLTWELCYGREPNGGIKSLVVSLVEAVSHLVMDRTSSVPSSVLRGFGR